VSVGQTAVEKMLRSRLPRVLHAEREARGWTQEEFAERAGIHWTTVGKVERGQQLPSLGLLVLWARALGAPLPELLARLGPVVGERAEDPLLARIASLTGPDRARLVPILDALIEWKRPGAPSTGRQRSARRRTQRGG
jgi:transcriptional regulator with XRE-family HTH domain